ncbi:ABC transporter substrate-binding protein [Erwinia sp.]|uniref:ABC transporter substrate-binding protein n=1 Tax=Erwinia citreus TaxID=558 RepID=UPI003C70EEEF
MTMMLKLNQGDRSESRIYYCAQYLAESLGLFARHGLSVKFTTAESGGHTVQGGQVPAVMAGEADLTIGGPMVMMKNHQENGPELLCFAAAVSANPWFLAAGQADGNFTLESLRGKRVIDVGNVGTATLSFNWLLRQPPLKNEVELIAGSGDEAADMAAVSRGEADYALHSMHALAPYIARGELHSIASLAPLCGAIPWSAYIARRDVLAEKQQAFLAFTAAMQEAQQWLHNHSAQALADRVEPWYQDYPKAALVIGLEAYLQANVFAASPLMAQKDFDRFAVLLTEAGWLSPEIPVPFAALVDVSLATSVKP